MYGGKGIYPLRVDDLFGETERQPAAISQSLLQHLKERQHLGRRLPAVPESMGRQQHDHHERVPDMVLHQRREAPVGSHRQDVPLLPEPERGHHSTGSTHANLLLFLEGRQVQLQGDQQENQPDHQRQVHGCSVVEEVWIQYHQRVPLNGQPGIYLLPGDDWLLVLLPKTESLGRWGLYSTIKDLR